MIKIKHIILLLIIPSFIFAGGGSVYTRYGLGNLEYTHSGRRVGFGGLGISIADNAYMNFLNPAGWYKLEDTRMELGLNYRGLQLDDGTNKVNYSNTVFSGLTIGFPIHKDYGIAAAIGIVPYSRVNYEVTGSNLADPPSELEQETYNLNYDGSGGLSKLFVGFSYKLPFDFILGATYEYYVGRIEYNSSLVFDETSDFLDVSYSATQNYFGPGATMGLISNDFAELLGLTDVEDFRIGLIYNIYSDLNTDTSLVSNSSIGELTLDEGRVRTSIPSRIGIGASLTWKRKFTFLVDYLHQPWTEYKLNNIKSDNLLNLERFSFGFEYKNIDRRSSSTFWEQFDVRGGLSYEKTQYNIFGENISQLALHFGFSFPISQYNSVDIGLAYGFRGTTDSDLIKENIFKGTISISLGELWFVRKER